MNRKTVRDYKEEGSFKDSEGNSRWFISPYYGGSIYSILTSPDEVFGGRICVGFRSYDNYLSGWKGISKLSLHLEDLEAMEEDHQRMKQHMKESWEKTPEDEKRRLVQFAYDNGQEIPEEDIKRYGIETIDS